MKTLVIGDIHGCYTEFIELSEAIPVHRFLEPGIQLREKKTRGLLDTSK
jgi:hypothetical protein